MEQEETLLKQTFDRWAPTYDQSVLKEQGYTAHIHATEIFCKYAKPDQNPKILDAGAGTGLVGQLLSEKGFTHLIAGDLSTLMLEQAKKKNVYQEFHLMVLGEALPFQTGEFDMTICVGVFQPCAAPSKSLHELVRVTKSLGIIVFTHVCYVEYRNILTGYDEEIGFTQLQRQLEEEGKWKLLEESKETPHSPLQDPDAMYKVWVYQVL